MEIEKEIFKRAKFDFKRAEAYGFVLNNSTYYYQKIFMDNFKLEVHVDLNGNMKCKIIDLSLDEEYINHRINQQIGEFVNQVREGYKNILLDICKHCTISQYFISDQANRLAQLIYKNYHDTPDYPWEKHDETGVFRNPKNNKWYALIMNINKNKLDGQSNEEIEILNIKVDNKMIPELLEIKGFYPAYHMTKKNWVTIILDNTVSDETIMQYLKLSHEFTNENDDWIIPANPKYYDVVGAFRQSDTLVWKQPKGINVGNIVYIYMAAPISAILYICEVIEIDIPYDYEDKNLKMTNVMKLKLRHKLKPNLYPFEVLKQYEINAIRSPRRMPKTLSEKIHSAL